MITPRTFSDQVANALFAGTALPLGLIVLTSMASGDLRYLPQWAPLALGWTFGLMATAIGAVALWSALRS